MDRLFPTSKQANNQFRTPVNYTEGTKKARRKNELFNGISDRLSLTH